MEMGTRILLSACLATICNAAHAQSETGCLHQSVVGCEQSFSAYISPELKDEFDRDLNERHNRVDVNGKHVGGNEITIDPEMDHSTVVVALTLDQSDQVKGMYIVFSGDALAALPETVMRAQTSDEYDQTKIFEIMQAAFGTKCVSDKLALYRFFENSVKPKLGSTKRDSQFYDTGVKTTYTRTARNIPFCGSKLTFESQSGIDTGDITEYNSTGDIANESIDVK